MAIIYPPGSILGPCIPQRYYINPDHPDEGTDVKVCADLACEHDRWMAAQACAECGEPVGYDRPFGLELWDHDPEGNPVVIFAHTVCLALRSGAQLADLPPFDVLRGVGLVDEAGA